MNSRTVNINLTNIKFKNSIVVYENFIKCTIKDYEMNLSYNPTLLSGSQGQLTPYSSSNSGSIFYIQSQENYGILKDFVTGSISGSDFSPYVTMVGLYNDSNDLLAVGKMAAPMPLSSNTDQTFLIKWDTKWSPKPYFTPSPSPSATPSLTPSISVTPSLTPSISVTPSVTPTVTPTVSLTPSPPLSVSVTPSSTPSISVTPSITITPSVTVTPSPTTSYNPYQAEINVFGEDNGTGYVVFTANVTSGNVVNSLSFTGEIQRYSDPSCSSQLGVECPFGGANMNSGDTTVSSSQLCSSSGAQTLKVILLYVNGTPIITDPQDIVVGGNTYRITGYFACGGL